MKNLDQLIELNEKKVALLKEYKESLAYEKCTYHVCKDEPARYFVRFLIYRISDQAQLFYGTAIETKKWFDKRKIDTAKVYNLPELLKELERIEQTIRQKTQSGY